MNTTNSVTWLDLGVPPESSVRTTPLSRIKSEPDFVVSGLARRAGVDLPESTKTLAMHIALEEADSGRTTLIDLVVAWKRQPELCDFANSVHVAAVRHDKLKK